MKKIGGPDERKVPRWVMSQGGWDVSRRGGPEERKVPRWERMHVARNYLIPYAGAHESPTPPRGKKSLYFK